MSKKVKELMGALANVRSTLEMYKGRVSELEAKMGRIQAELEKQTALVTENTRQGAVTQERFRRKVSLVEKGMMLMTVLSVAGALYKVYSWYRKPDSGDGKKYVEDDE